MELKQLEAFVKVYELQSFSKTAEDMFLSQPSISAYIHSLEKELQTVLFHRSTKEFQPTKSGKLFYEYAKNMLSLRDKSIVFVRNMSDCNAGSIDILASSVPSQYILPEILGAFHEICPFVTFTIEQAGSSDVIKGIAAYRSEIGFVGAKIENPKCVYEDFMSEKLIIVAPYDKQYENIDSSDISSLLQREYFVAREAGSGTRLMYEDYLKQIGVQSSDLRVSACFSNTQSVLHAVANGLGLSIVSELAAKSYIRQNMVLPIYVDSLPERHFYIVLKKNTVVSPVSENFISFVRTLKKNL